MNLHPCSDKIAYRSGQIEGMAMLLIIRKEMSRSEIEESLREIIQWSKDIHVANRDLLPDISSKEESKHD